MTTNETTELFQKLQERAYENKVKHNFNIKDLNMEFCLLYGEVAETYEAWRESHSDLDGELADIAIYLLGIAEILHINLGEAILDKMTKNEKRIYPKRKSTVKLPLENSPSKELKNS